jgi:hypothetical protein
MPECMKSRTWDFKFIQHAMEVRQNVAFSQSRPVTGLENVTDLLPEN